MPVDGADGAYDPAVLGAALGALLRDAAADRPHATWRCRASRSASGSRTCARCCAAARFSFDDAVKDADRVTVCVTVFALLELYKRGEAAWEQDEPFGPITVRAAARRARPRHDASPRASRRCCSSRPSRSRSRSSPTRCRPPRRPSRRRARELEADARRPRRSCCARVAGGLALASHPDAEEAARRLLARPRTPALTPAQAETLAIVAYLQPVSRPEVARIRGVASESATVRAGRARPDRGGRPLAVRRRPLPHDAAVPEALRAQLARGAAGHRAVGPEPGGGSRAARPPAAGRRARAGTAAGPATEG